MGMQLVAKLRRVESLKIMMKCLKSEGWGGRGVKIIFYKNKC